MNQHKNKIVTLVVVVLVVLGVASLIDKQDKDNGYSVVYLTTGEVYVGKLTTFPDLQLKDSYIFQVTKDTTNPDQSNFQLQPVKDTLWAPEVLHLNKKNVVFYGPLLATSKIAETLAAQVK